MVERREFPFAGACSGSRTFAVAAAAMLAMSVLIRADAALAQLNVQPPQTQASPSQPQPAAVPAQTAPQGQPAPQPQPAQPETPPKKDGFFDALGKWWDKSAADFDANLKKMKTDIDAANERNAKAMREATQGAATATKEATDALTKLSTSRIVEGKERCALAPNGSPDCGPAAEQICKAKGYKTGQSANIESARKCSARALLTRDESGCTNETIVTRAACQ
jgi:hypothetical protein